MFASILAAAVAAAVSPTPSPAATAPPQIAHVVTSDRGRESAAQTARSTYVVTAAEIARNGYRTVADALQHLPGVNVVRYGAFGSDTAVGIRGSSAEQVLVLLDGLPVAGAQTENVQLGLMPVTGIERIEVVEGGGSTLYGSGSIGGVINIITGAPRSAATISTGSFGEQSYLVQTPYFSFQRTYASNDYGLPGGGSRTNAAAGLTSGSVNFDRDFGSLHLRFLADASQSGVGAPGPIPYVSATSRQDTNARDLRMLVEKRSPHADLSLSLGASSNALSYTCNAPDDADCPNSFVTPNAKATAPPYAQLMQDQRVALDLDNVAGGDRERLVYGVDLARGNDRIDGGTGSACPPSYVYAYKPCGALAYETSITPNAYAQTAAFVQSQWFSPNGGEIYLGLRGERDLNALASAQGGALSPSAGAIVVLARGLQLKLNAATAFRAPSAFELFYPPQGVYSNDKLVPERTRVGDATVVSSTAWGEASIGWFTTSGSNLIVDENPAAFDYKPVNVGRASIQGFTVGLRTLPWRRMRADVSVTDLYRAQDLDTQTRIVGRGPVFASTLGLRYLGTGRFDGAGVTLTNNGAAEPADFTNVPYAQAQAFTTLDAYAGVRLAPHAALVVRGFNLLDDRYAIYNGYPMPGPGFAIEVRSRP